MNFSTVNVTSKQAISIRDHCPAAGLAKIYNDIYNELQEIMKKQSLQISAPPFGIYHGFSQEDVDVEPGIPVSGNPVPEGRMNVINTYAGKAVKLDFYGHYTSLANGWNAMTKYVEENNLKPSAPCFEVYITISDLEPDPEKWHTEIYYPVL